MRTITPCLWFDGRAFTFSEAVSLEVHCDSADEVDHFYDSLVQGGTTQPCGWLKDRFGFSWQVVPPGLLSWLNGPDRDAAARVANVLHATHGKLDTAALRAAYEG